MKSSIKKTIALILTLIMLAGTVAVGASAATKETVFQYGKEGGYLAIGDSISRGCGAEGFYIDQDKAEGGQYDEFFLRNVQGAITTQIAEAVGCEMPEMIEDQNATFWPLCYPGMTTAVALDILGIEDDFTDTKLDYPYYDDMLEYFGWEGSLTGARGETYDPETCGKCGNAIELVQKADLITVELGLCDVFYRTYRIISNGGMLADGLQFDLSSASAIVDLVENAVTELNFGYKFWESHYTMIIEKLQELNPDATIVMVGAFNLLDQLTITDETMAPIGNVADVLTNKMNCQYEKWAKKYNVIYVDVSSTETQATELDWSLLGDFMDNSFTGTHPTQNGYDYMARRILEALPEYDDCKYIKVDLARFDKVDYVLVNGIPVNNYTMDGCIITIPYSGPLANRLTIGVKNEDGTVSVQTYDLDYNCGRGYTARRIFGRNDIAGYFKRPLALFKTIFTMIFDAIKGIFS